MYLYNISVYKSYRRPIAIVGLGVAYVFANFINFYQFYYCLSIICPFPKSFSIVVAQTLDR